MQSTKSLGCRNFNTFMRTEREALRHAIEEHKWYLSERAGYDVGWEAAKRQFYREFLMGFSKEYRRVFCEQRCDYKNSCDLYRIHRAQADKNSAYAIC